MGVSTQQIAVAECDDPKCNVRRAGTQPGGAPDGFEVTVKVTAEDGTISYTIEGWSCRETHVGPAFRALLHRHDSSEAELDGYIGDPDDDPKDPADASEHEADGALNGSAAIH